MTTKTKIYFLLEFAKGDELFTKIANGRFDKDLYRNHDLKPENLLLNEKWNLKFMDFRLYVLSDSVQSDELLHTLCGNPAYVTPELQEKKVTKKR